MVYFLVSDLLIPKPSSQIIELVGEMPREIALAGKYSSEHFNKKAQLRRIAKLRYWGLSEVLKDKYLLAPEEAQTLASFLEPMLRYDITKRATAAEMVGHKWLDGVIVQGEIDLLEEHARKLEAEQGRPEPTPETTTT